MLLESWLVYLLYLIPAIIVISFILIFCFIDCDITLWIFSRIGKSSSTYFKDKVVWITGASSGIGEEIAYQLSALSCKLVLCGTRGHRLEHVKRQCLLKNPSMTENDIIVLVFDMRETEKMSLFVQNVVTRFKKIDILINNAGRSQRAMFAETSIEVDREMFDVNVFGALHLTRCILSHWRQQKVVNGQIAVMSSLAGKVGAPYSSTYTGSKHALHGYFESVRNESFSEGIRITIICPGPVVSEVTEHAYTASLDKRWNRKHADDKSRMPTSRCAFLSIASIVNQLDEVWISQQPALTWFYAAQYLPSVTRFVFPRIMTKERIMRMRDGEDNTVR
jgi:dehydrogenase/reductase SDR family protein 7